MKDIRKYNMKSRTIKIPPNIYDLVLAIGKESSRQNLTRGNKPHFYNECKRGNPEYIEELRGTFDNGGKVDQQLMVTCNGYGAEYAVCEWLGIKWDFRLGEWKKTDAKYNKDEYPRLTDCVIEIKSSVMRWHNLLINKNSYDNTVQAHLDDGDPLPDVYALALGYLNGDYWIAGFIEFEEATRKERLRPHEDENRTHFRVEQNELWMPEKASILVPQLF